ncbi:bifunctional diaminohydroxyphosphoribosylaminopyrimidine deaminase/5-amino-6-(5-phosphoribosylamino)uracil reductase RibD [Granulicella mallensis]|uniref:Riboflavin biosynthesis protein RibD n=1 Tax=Granulicella mallensis TaxID=940614 RepID=A0A7W8EAP2_9BACT|nr:bifunctional diaminohydroxyphosphoribosylaminopyrimidine deaminase/5-amino-6-(5-phosphoribosylamino)uracil reductase RibD [Granulicella mallensis]MBB5064714.1 diaminohydroxyphosphoribosylaminopyrimidine deaminase/5-amino-6-(5-phosphoribosylamino)uracil reductase [Granulicella mallensis]
MSLLPHDERHLQRALDLAQEAVGLASPNPTVGCVLVRDSAVLGEGAHHYDERDHAEIAALKQAASLGHTPQSATAYVTLEPCSHQGRTGPCADALIAADIARCVVATVDPNPLVSGGGLAKLRTAGIEVVVADPASAPAQRARRLNDAFAHWIQHRRPFVTLKAAVSVDGKLAPAPSVRTANQPHWLTGEAARADVHRLRHEVDAILTGIGTVLADDPSLTDRSGLPRRRSLLRVILDSDLRTPLDSQLVRSASSDLLLLCSMTAPADREAALSNCGVEVLRLSGSGGHLNLRAALDMLAQRNIISVLVEGGSSLNGSLLRVGLVDKLTLYYAERELGLDAIPFAEGIASPYVVQEQLQRMERTSLPHGTAEDVRITGYLHDPWAGI